MSEVAMHHTQDPGKVSLTDGAQGANRLSMPEHIMQVAMQVPGTVDFYIGIALASI